MRKTKMEQPKKKYRGHDLVTIRQGIQKLHTVYGAEGITEHALRRWINEGRIPHVKSGNRYLISLEDIAEFIDSAKYGV